ncbi:MULTISPECIES: fumarate hydratase [Caproicibacterium]|uniref:Fumarate hydratase n=1 Tax=Caproicibacterium lactatifermentans TaxID=2666138 RepID=A0A859DTN3_9FIRM|nr:fumarate hydratase [Caproicibacterium lactatifermentans]ARP50707.1 fumarate hydratase [Ruminococcaceae bacterium CPB6]MDD4807444.1 fumarate hydratase [Oscillospiraceae bacterium]QKN23563.1 fumarate hydratase [Caproicibacterium lactatifermentans]QKO29761.1 fumarate hydratase [Caproicibacterium lactatifermentans]
MRELNAQCITDTIAELCVKANRSLPTDLESCIREKGQEESSPIGKAVFQDLCDNMEAARRLSIPVCQDTGMAVVFAEVGQEVHITGSFEEAVNRGVAKGYTEGLLRCSVAADPIRRGNTGDNTPAILHTRLVPGDKVHLTVAPKGFGSENMSRLKMLTPAASEADIIGFVVETARLAGSNPCPPMVLGVGIGGDFEKCAELAKEALCRPVSEKNPDPYYAQLEEKMLKAVNDLHIGPQGFGGDITCLSLAICQFPTHIAGLPVAVNVGCHVTRHADAVL